eukprot:TRINITY_DN13282_c0_g1_i1.p1 TRINITY_DN13282_c0_g1~~TRINITY_DN13282_c0_g1_i1.p1  ORF type:complete len:514 (+),score=151.50 TRINITY_DN13282_c0_g1_i1:35-1576(+)
MESLSTPLDTFNYPFDFDTYSLLPPDDLNGSFDMESPLSECSDMDSASSVVPGSPSQSDDSSVSDVQMNVPPMMFMNGWSADGSLGYSVFDQVVPLNDYQVQMMSGGYLGYGAPVEQYAYPQVCTSDIYHPVAVEGSGIELANRKRKAEDVADEKVMPPKKKRKISVDLNPETNGCLVTFERKDLLQISSEEFDDYFERLASFKTITKSDKKEISRQRKLIKNRESAKESRQRKKSHVASLEQKVNDLTERNVNLQAALNSANQENMHLRMELDKYRKMAAGQKQDIQQYPPGGVVLFVFLLSFGLFFGFGPKFGLEEADSFKPFSERIFTPEDKFKPTGFDLSTQTKIVNPRIQDVFNKGVMDVDPKREIPQPDVSFETQTNYSAKKLQERKEQGPSASEIEQLQNAHLKFKHEIKIEPNDAKMGEIGMINALDINKPKHQVPELTFEENTTYLLCKQMQYLQPNKEMEYNPDLPLRLSILMQDDDNAEEYTQVMCQVTDMKQTRFVKQTSA